jgi:mono/diheme cytochrome c family protein
MSPLACHVTVTAAILVSLWTSLHGMKLNLCVAAEIERLETPPRPEFGRGDPEAARRGYRFLTEKAYLPPDFTQEVFDESWRAWPEPLRTKAEKASLAERRKMAMERYGITPRPGDPTRPLQYVVNNAGEWTLNCFGCHGGQVAGQVIPGLPNAHYALETLTEETRSVKAELGKSLSRMDVGMFAMPLGTTNGTTNAVMFGVALMAARDAELNVVRTFISPRMVHHDMDAPPWWHFHKRRRLYIDGFVAKEHRSLMQFMLIRQNGPEKFREWEADFRDVYAYLESLRPPAYPYAIDRVLADRGETIFNDHCARCHGTYGPQGKYQEVMVSLDEIGTDPVRHGALTKAMRQGHEDSWFGHFGVHKVLNDPKGYVAPPLDGVWASAPYFHNGSVPTLWHVLHPESRPAIWTRSATGYDRERVGLEHQTVDTLPSNLSTAERRRYFDTSVTGKSRAGHTFPNDLSEEEKRAVLEYLKSL